MKFSAQAPDPEALRAQIAANVPMRRLGTGDEVCDMVAFLASDRVGLPERSGDPARRRARGAKDRLTPVRGGLPVLDADGHVVEPGDVFADVVPPGVEVFDLPATTPLRDVRRPRAAA